MKKNLLLLGMLVVGASPVLASVDVHTTTEPYYLRNGNYSSEAVRLIQLNKHYANGVEINTRTSRFPNDTFWHKTGNVVDAVFKYIDPAWDDKKFFVRDMPQQPGFNDL